MRIHHVTAVLLSGLLAVGTAACQRSGSETTTTGTTADQNAPVQVASLEVGKHIGNDNQVTEPTDAFAPNETVYASVVTNGSASTAELKTRWTYQDGQVVDEVSRTIAPSGGATTEFHVSKPDGLPVGKYRVEVFLNGAPAASKEFEVKGT
jgi:hypothetical protein